MKFLYIIFVYHIIILISMFDVYFQSPVIYGMQPIENTIKPLAKRLVLFVGDGIRSDLFYGKQLNLEYAPYLRSKMEEGSPWGISYTRVPTESRPGHVAIIAGLYEDPSAVFKGWRENPVAFDSVFNQSYATFSWGSPDIVPIFSNEQSNSNIFWYSYSHEIQDFSGKNESALYLNNWVYENFKQFLELTKSNNTSHNLIRHERIILFFHLLGVDVIGHIRKPNSEYYMGAISNTDDVIKNITELIENTFKDDKTAYIFTSDHGMTDWGSHGAGSKSEIETPIIAWGSGIKKTNCGIFSSCSKNMNQADISVLMSLLLGISIPVHSTGILPQKYLDLEPRDQALGLLLNARQLLSQLNKKEEDTRNSMAAIFFTPYKGLTEEIQKQFFQKIMSQIDSRKYDKAVVYGMFQTKNIEILMEEALNGLHYYTRYFQNFKLVCLVLTFLGLLCLLSSEILPYMAEMNVITEEFSSIGAAYGSPIYLRKRFTILALLFTLLCVYTMPVTFIVYIALPIPLFGLAFMHYRLDKAMLNVVRSKHALIQIFLYFGGLQVIFFETCSKTAPTIFFKLGMLAAQFWSFYHRWVLSLLMLSLNFWPYTVTRQTIIDQAYKTLWSVSCIILAIFPLLPTVGEISQIGIVSITCLFWLSIGALWIYRMFHEDYNFPMDYSLIIKCLLVVPVIINIIMIDISFSIGDGLRPTNQISSYAFLVMYSVLLFFGPNFAIPKYFTISYSLGMIFILFCSGHESLFTLFLCLHLGLWISIEMLITNYNSKDLLKTIISAPLEMKQKMIGPADFRRSFFYLFYIVFSFFGIGNIDSLNSFDLAWVRGFVTIFSPFLITSLVLLKTIIPFIIVASAFRLVVLKTESNVHGLFMIVLLFCDILGIEFLFKIQNYGSWLQIGKSISHFVIIEVTTLVLIGLYGLTSILIRPIKDVNIPYSKTQ